MDEKGCQLWTRATNFNGGYGVFRRAGQLFYAHRVVLEEKLGRPLGVGMCALHTCDTPSCINPDHLFEGSHQLNAQDRTRKGRGVNPSAMKTRCKRGHQLPPFVPGSKRDCKACHSERMRVRRAAKRQTANQLS